ncbi:hypothetical protein H4217_008321 [Coemansia sp. RSA 1939]|nr:hypothetical protein H4217_008321 [Coemansia sp. RSA 1939]KAJ2605101.1 hypothetical protein EV177_006223 [Coemansia sp. RSA 1804]KAJ2691471.1 hypothetical protein GGH99_002397 [Coemansia sp. RSA 1285]
MAKSARSKSSIKNRNALRATVFGPHEAARIKRLAEKQRITAGSTADLMVEDSEEPASGTSAAAKDVEMAEANNKNSGDNESGSKRSSKKTAKGGKNGKRIVVRNKKGRVMSRNSVSWVKQKRFK